MLRRLCSCKAARETKIQALLRAELESLRRMLLEYASALALVCEAPALIDATNEILAQSAGYTLISQLGPSRDAPDAECASIATTGVPGYSHLWTSPSISGRPR